MSEEIKNEKDLTFKRLNKHLKKAKIIDFDPRQDRAIIFSDHHMGNGITGIEIESGNIGLVWWKREPMERKVIREDKLDNIFRAIDGGGIS